MERKKSEVRSKARVNVSFITSVFGFTTPVSLSLTPVNYTGPLLHFPLSSFALFVYKTASSVLPRL